jgi:hypothetical protein
MIDSQNPYVGSVTGSGPHAGDSRPADLFTQQTGQVLLEMGNLFLNVPPFNEHIDQNTGRLLISIGNKLKTRK